MWKQTALSNIDHDIGWNDLSCWASIFYLLALGMNLPLRLSDCFIVDSIFYPLYRVNTKPARPIQGLLRSIEKNLNNNPLPSISRIIDPFIQHQKWKPLIKAFTTFGVLFDVVSLDDKTVLHETTPFIAFVNSFFLPYWRNDFLSVPGGLYKNHHCLLVTKCERDTAFVQDPALQAYDGPLLISWLLKSIAIHTGMPDSHEGKILQFYYSANQATRSHINTMEAQSWRVQTIEQLINTMQSRPNMHEEDCNLISAVSMLQKQLRRSDELAKVIIPVWVKHQLMLILIAYNGFLSLAQLNGIDPHSLSCMKDLISSFVAFLNTFSGSQVGMLRDLTSLFRKHLHICCWLLCKLKSGGLR